VSHGAYELESLLENAAFEWSGRLVWGTTQWSEHQGKFQVVRGLLIGPEQPSDFEFEAGVPFTASGNEVHPITDRYLECGMKQLISRPPPLAIFD
jgi:hypothetical protein